MSNVSDQVWNTVLNRLHYDNGYPGIDIPTLTQVALVFALRDISQKLENIWRDMPPG